MYFLLYISEISFVYPIFHGIVSSGLAVSFCFVIPAVRCSAVRECYVTERCSNATAFWKRAVNVFPSTKGKKQREKEETPVMRRVGTARQKRFGFSRRTINETAVAENRASYVFVRRYAL